MNNSSAKFKKSNVNVNGNKMKSNGKNGKASDVSPKDSSSIFATAPLATLSFDKAPTESMVQGARNEPVYNEYISYPKMNIKPLNINSVSRLIAEESGNFYSDDDEEIVDEDLIIERDHKWQYFDEEINLFMDMDEKFSKVLFNITQLKTIFVCCFL